MGIKFVPRDLWIGLYVGKLHARYGDPNCPYAYRDYYLCVVPMFPLHWKSWRLRKLDTVEKILLGFLVPSLFAALTLGWVFFNQ